MPQNFHCPKCKTLWIEYGNNWVLVKKVKCPFCGKVHSLSLSMENCKMVGKIIGQADATPTNKLD
jgi:hypothetical protein